MTSHDPAFQWETEVLRSSRRAGRRDRPTGNVLENGGDWLTLREASEATGVPTSTLRKWVRHDNIPSFLEQTSGGYIRIVSMSGIERWAEEIGRDIGADTDIDLSVEESAGGERTEPDIPEGSMLVPLDAWNRMLNQLGNLHEAGQQLAEARERAARAETEAAFLKERLTDLRDELEAARGSSDTEPGPAGRSQPGPGPSSLIKSLYDGWRSRRRG